MGTDGGTSDGGDVVDDEDLDNLTSLPLPLGESAGRTQNLFLSLCLSLSNPEVCSNSKSWRWKPMFGLTEVLAPRTACSDS